MNYLAHLYLAGQEKELIIGNFIADSVKGSHYKNYSDGIAQGILMHRAIDYFADNHEIYLTGIHRLNANHGKFAGVITDMLYDNLLASNWEKFSDISLEEFAKKMYYILDTQKDLMPEKSKIILHYMSQYNWLVSYRSMEGIRRALYGLSKRMKYYHPMDSAIGEIEANLNLYQKEFIAFMPLLQEHLKSFKKT
jgi:acyl carrier protein phosphodiesterase